MWSGLLVGMGFVVQAVGMLFFAKPFFSGLFLLVGLLLVPLLLTRELQKYRLLVFGSRISYIQCVGVMGAIYLFALIVATLAFLLVFTYLFRDGTFLLYLEQSLDLTAEMMGTSEEALSETYLRVTAGGMTQGVISLSFTLGVIYIFVASAFLRKE